MEDLYEILRKFGPVYMIYDQAVEYVADEIAGAVPLKGRLSIEACDATKNLDTVQDICQFLLALGADRDAFVLAVGGGTTSDIVGFAAAIYKRGVRFGIAATTLLAMVDASLGGKTGVNLYSFKNILGAFHQPEFSYPVISSLETLPRREMLSGAAEMLKTFVIENEDHHYEDAVAYFSGAGDDSAQLRRLVDAAAAVKRGVVERDPFERGERRSLNLGHTVGHAIEWYEHTHGVADPMTHGEAVAVGLVQAARLAEECGVAEPGLAARLQADLAACGLPTALPYPMEALEEAIRADKKNLAGEVRYVLPVRIGKVLI